MRSYYDIATEIVPGWWKPSGVDIKRGVNVEKDDLLLRRWPQSLWFSGKTDLVVAYPSGKSIDTRDWETQPHVELANIGFSAREYLAHKRESENRKKFDHPFTGYSPTAEEVKEFVATYGPLVADPSGRTTPTEIYVPEFRDMQEKLRQAWSRNDAKFLWFVRGAEELDQFEVPFTWAGGGLALRPADLWTYIRLLLTRDLGVGRAKVCRFPECTAPFCVKKRTDFEFCSHECAVRFTNLKNSLKRRRMIRHAGK